MSDQLLALVPYKIFTFRMWRLTLSVCTSLLDGFDVLHSTNVPFDGSAAVNGLSESEPYRWGGGNGG